MVGSFHLERFASLASRSPSTGPLHAHLRVALVATHTTIFRSKNALKREGLGIRVRDATISLDCSLSSKVSTTNEICPNRVVVVGAGEIRGYSATESDRQQQAKSNGRSSSAADETLDMLGWPSLCEAVARFATTAMGKDFCHGLAPPRTMEESRVLLDETDGALELDSILDFGHLAVLLSLVCLVVGRTSRDKPIWGSAFASLHYGCTIVCLVISDLLGPRVPQIEIKSGLDRVSKGMDVSGKALVAIATLLQVAQTLQRGVFSLLEGSKGRKDVLQSISKLIEPMVVHQEVMKFIFSKIDEDGTVKDTASPQLRQARIEARTLEQRLQELLNKLARENSGPAGAAQEIIDVDGRFCLAVPTGTGSSSVSGLLFQRGTSAYLEPSQAVSLNSKLAEARLEVQSAERAVLSGIAAKLRPDLVDVHFVLQSIVRLDVIAARGKYSSSIGGRKPEFVDSNVYMQTRFHEQSHNQGTKTVEDDVFNGDHDNNLFLMNLKKLRHPLLVEKYHQGLRKAKAKLKEKARLLSRTRVRVSSITSNVQLKDEVTEAEVEVAAAEARAPVPIDLRVSAHTRVVAITGPNAGGKTAAIKAVGLAALMAKVGLYVLASDPVYIPWFDGVFADIGDEQSLGQSLSTFSAHLLRIKRILSECTEHSLILLDELSAGTDPTEGAALGMALLESFAAGRSLLTMATTHHGELKTLKYSDHRFENACVEFDEENLAPTYKLLWGIPGRSNALNVARRQGLPSAILSNAESLYGAASAELNDVILKLEGAKVDFDQSREESEALVDEMKEFYSQLVASAERLYEHDTVLYSEKCQQLDAIAGAAHLRLNSVARTQSQNIPSGTARTQSQSIPKPLSGQTSGQTTPLKKEEFGRKDSGSDGRSPRVGQLVYVPKLGRDAKVVGVNEAKKEITVQSGFLQIKIDMKEVP